MPGKLPWRWLLLRRGPPTWAVRMGWLAEGKGPTDGLLGPMGVAPFWHQRLLQQVLSATAAVVDPAIDGARDSPGTAG